MSTKENPEEIVSLEKRKARSLGSKEPRSEEESGRLRNRKLDMFSCVVLGRVVNDHQADVDSRESDMSIT